MMPGAALFDMDGLLVDTEPLWLEAETEVMARLGAPWSAQDQHALVGGSMSRAVEYLLARARLASADLPAPPLPAPETVERWLADGMLARIAAGRVIVAPGARELLGEVAAAGVPHALVTSSQREITEAVLASARLSFPVVVTGDDVTAHKPDPAPYLMAAGLLGTDPARCVALEDSPNGVASAGAAGCLVIAVPSLLPISPAPGRVVMRSLTQVTLEVLGLLASGAGMP
jgi:HAD superfamily hydrolase (TIGR01509 family)